MPEHLDPSVFAAPVYIVAMIWEHHRTRRQRERGEAVLGYEKRDTIASLGTGIVSVLTVGVMGLGVTALAEWMHAHRLLTLEGWKAWAVGMIAWDFAYYWLHRFEHSVRLLWATHVSHHSSERYNFSTALRQPWLPWFSFVMLPPIALLGVEPWVILTCGGINLIYQFFVHTEAVGKLPAPIEWVFNTPSHHRVHHASNPQYLDKNHGGILIVWDRLFGSFEPEVEPVVYGLTKNVGTFDLWTIFVHEYVAIARDVVRARSWRERFAYVFADPGWKPRG
jgi:sterol desaturase/sphingolipid hydroxylase (fatty acid hydroxylase superfamily)